MLPKNLHLIRSEHSLPRGFETGVSLHSHTSYSEENLNLIPRYVANFPLIGSAMRRHEQEYRASHGGHPIDYSRGFWTPPFPPREAWHLEAGQMEKLGLRPLVSLTDHDSIAAPLALSLAEPALEAPVSVEWSIPYGPTFFHVGVHNLPAADAPRVMAELAAYTQKPRRALLGELLETLGRDPSTLLVLNHPLWDEARIGATEHARVLGSLLERHGAQFHALELNGLRGWRENQAVIRLASESGHPLISGGDRHGSEPNATINLTNARSFAEFVEEVRLHRHSEVAFLPQYFEPLRCRVLQVMMDVVKDYPEHPQGRRTWDDRVFYRYPDGRVRPVSEIFAGKVPRIVRQFVWSMRVIESKSVRSALRIALSEAREFAS
jgi:hypothetical protein